MNEQFNAIFRKGAPTSTLRVPHHTTTWRSRIPAIFELKTGFIGSNDAKNIQTELLSFVQIEVNDSLFRVFNFKNIIT